MKSHIMPPIKDNSEMTLVEHLTELRSRLMWAVLAFVLLSCVSYSFAEQIYRFLVMPLADVLEGENRRLIYTGLTEVFFTYMKLSLFMGGFLAFPVIAVQIWAFIAPGLYKNEKRAFLPFLIATPILFFVGAAFAYYVVFPLAWQFFSGFENPGISGDGLPIVLETRVSEYLSLVTKLIFAFGICFELPVLLLILARVGIVTANNLAAKRKYALIMAFVIGAVLTPPDIISQISLAIPMLGLYELSIFMIRLMGSPRKSA